VWLWSRRVWLWSHTPIARILAYAWSTNRLPHGT